MGISGDVEKGVKRQVMDQKYKPVSKKSNLNLTKDDKIIRFPPYFFGTKDI